MCGRIEETIRPEIRDLQAYHVPSAKGMVKLDAMENPYHLPDEMQNAWLNSLRELSLNRYPDPESSELKQCLREVMNIPDSLDIMLGNGSDELIQIVCMAVADVRKRKYIKNAVLGLEPSFVMYRLIASFFAMDYIAISLSKDFSISVDAVEIAILKHKPAVIFIAYPNNPTGNLYDEKVIKRIIDIAPGVVVIDEAYYPFAKTSFLSNLEQYENVLLIRTVSKMGLAGLRLGYLIASPDWVSELNKLRLPYNINILTQQCANTALNYIDVLNDQADSINSERQRLFNELARIEQFTVYPSATNFILFKTAEGMAARLYEILLNNKILIKNLDGGSELLRDCLRVTVGTPDENNQFLNVVRDFANQ